MNKIYRMDPELLPALAALIEKVRSAHLAFIGDSDTALISDFSREAWGAELRPTRRNFPN